MAVAAQPLSPVDTDLVSTFAQARTAIGERVRGKQEVIELALIAVVARGHLLLEDIPGVGKSSLAQALAQVLGGTFRRVQFTSDLLPSDLVGVNVWRTSDERFEFRPGPIFANVVLADEINRAPPRTQSALLEAMGEQQVSIDGTSHPLPRPFFVVATQNPVEHHGTYPLPESQRDRFTLRLDLGYAAAEVEAELLRRPSLAAREVALASILDAERVLRAQRQASEIFVHADIAVYAQRVVAATRTDPRISLGVSTRAALSWIAAARARAYLEARPHVTLDDLQELAVPALAHRILPARTTATSERAVAEELVRDVVAKVPIPL
jgi:MoxR-like ATPase